MNKLWLALPLLLVLLPSWARDSDGPGEIPEPPALPPQVESGQMPQVESGQVPQPDVTIVERKNETIEQYSVNGHVYMVKIVPRRGPPYYLMDLDGDGELDVRRDSPGDISIPQWVLFSW